MKHEDRVRDVARLGVELDRGELRRLEAFEELLRTRGVALGLIARGDRERIWERHILDALRGAALLPRFGRRLRVADVGSGAGLPGIPIATARPDVDMVLIEPRHRRVGFLELAVERLELANVSIEPRRIQEIGDRFDACLARALASPRRVWEMTRPLLAPEGQVLVWVGRGEPVPSIDAHVRLVHARHLVNAGAIAIMTRQ